MKQKFKKGFNFYHKLNCLVFFVFIPWIVKSQSDTLFSKATQNEQIINWNNEYHQTLTMKLMLAQAKYDGRYKRKDNGEMTVHLTFEQALNVIRKIDHLTMGIPKIIYLVGWQYNGHDSRYPAWFEVNKALKRKKDKTALESLKWLMNEAIKYNTTLSVHINMFDAYEDSPLWDVYVENNIIARNVDGSLREGEWGYPISYVQELKTGYAQKRIDSLCALLPLADAGTIHIDAFHSWAPIGEKGPGQGPFIQGPISPYLGFSVEDETNAQKEIFKYWASKGVDVTSEGATFLRQDKFAGLQPMAWWVDWTLEDYMKWPASFYSGGIDKRDFGLLFGTSMHGEDIAMRDPENLSGFKKDFCTQTLVWYYLNRLDRLFYVKQDQQAKVQFSDKVMAVLEDNKLTIGKDGFVLVDENEVFVPVLWMEGMNIIAYSENGYKGKVWNLPSNWSSVKEIDAYEITINGLKSIGTSEVEISQISLDLRIDQMLLLKPRK